MIPTFVFAIWLWGLLSLSFIVGGIYFIYEWYQRVWRYDSTLERVVFDPNFGFNLLTAFLVGGLILLVWAFAGRFLMRLFLGNGPHAKDKAAPPRQNRDGVVHRLSRADGSILQVEEYGPKTAPALILTHGWGLNGNEWNYLKEQLTERFRLFVWDLPGLGLSTQPADRDFHLETLARDLEGVLGLAGDRPAVLLGHSIGGMVTLTFCRLFPEALGKRVAGLVLVHTTYTNPVRTTTGAGFFTAIERPLIVPLLYLAIWLSPLVRVMIWLSYLNGTAHLSTKLMGFAGTETWEQIDFATAFQLQAPPAVLARGMLGMLAYDATDTLATIHIPTLVIAGDRDPVCRPEASERIHQGVRDSELTSLSPAKHMGLIEQHGRFAKLIGEFAHTCFNAVPFRR